MVKKKKIIVVPLAGLGNRMRVLSSCIQIAKRDDRALWIAWPVNSDLGCDIKDIFESIGIDYSVPPKWLHYLLINIYKLSLIRRFYRFYKLISNVFFSNSIFDADIINNKQLNQLNQLKIDKNGSTLLIATCFAFNDQDYKTVSFTDFTEYLKNEVNREAFKSFNFTDRLKDEVNREYQKIGGPYIGIHIRRTDHSDVIKHSPNQNYLTQIDKCILENPMQKFFLASDDEETKLYFTKKYNNRIYTLKYKLGREDLEGIYGAVIELILLSKSIKIICSIISSYSNTAVLIGDIKEVIYADTFLNQEQQVI